MGNRTGIGAANGCNDCFSELGISSGSFKVADCSVGVESGDYGRSSTIWEGMTVLGTRAD